MGLIKVKKAVEFYKNEYSFKHMIEDENLTLYSFTNVSVVEGVCLATRTPPQNIHDVCYYRVLDMVHKHHLDKLNRLREALNERDYKRKMYEEKRTERVKDWFRKVHTEVYQRGRK